MNIWGISANSHDAAVSVWHDKQLQFAAHSEIYSGNMLDASKYLFVNFQVHLRRWDAGPPSNQDDPLGREDETCLRSGVRRTGDLDAGAVGGSQRMHQR